MVINWKCDPCRDAVLVAHIEANAEKHILYHNIWSVRKLRSATPAAASAPVPNMSFCMDHSVLTMERVS